MWEAALLFRIFVGSFWCEWIVGLYFINRTANVGCKWENALCRILKTILFASAYKKLFAQSTLTSFIFVIFICCCESSKYPYATSHTYICTYMIIENLYLKLMDSWRHEANKVSLLNLIANFVIWIFMFIRFHFSIVSVLSLNPQYTLSFRRLVWAARHPTHCQNAPCGFQKKSKTISFSFWVEDCASVEKFPLQFKI